MDQLDLYLDTFICSEDASNGWHTVLRLDDGRLVQFFQLRLVKSDTAFQLSCLHWFLAF